MSHYTDLRLLEDEGEERTALLGVVEDSLSEAQSKSVATATVTMMYQRLMRTGQMDGRRPVRPLKLTVSTADSNRVVDQILARLKEAIGRGFQGTIVVGIEDPDRRNEPLAGVWERRVSFGDAEDDPYGMNAAIQLGGTASPQQGGYPPQGGGGYSQQGGGYAQQPQQGGGYAPQGRSMHGPAGGTLHGPPGMQMDSFDAPPPPRLAGFGDRAYDPGSYDREASSPEDRDMFRSIVGSLARDKDSLLTEMRARDQGLFRMQDYFLRQNHQFMQFFGMVFGRGLPPAQAGPAPMNPLAQMAVGLIHAFFPPPASAPQPGGNVPAPPQIQGPPPHRDNFHDPNGGLDDLNIGPAPGPHPAYDGGSYAGSFSPHGQAAESFRTPQGESEWAEAMQADPDGAMAAARNIVPAPFKGFFPKGGGNEGGGHGPVD